MSSLFSRGCLAFALSVLGLAAVVRAGASEPEAPDGGEAALVIAVTPGAFVERNGQRAALALKDAVFVQDTIVTDATGKAQLLFRDDTTVAVASDSTIAIAQFAFGGAARPSFGMRIGQGVSRVVTGRVVEQNREGFHIDTPHATVGIRGTILTPRVSADATTVVVSQIGAGHTVSVLNTGTGQVSEVGRGSMTVIASPSGNVARPATPAEMSQAAAVARGNASDATGAQAAPAAVVASDGAPSAFVAGGTDSPSADTAADTATAAAPTISPRVSGLSEGVTGMAALSPLAAGNAPSPALDAIASKVEEAVRDAMAEERLAVPEPDVSDPNLRPDIDRPGSGGLNPAEVNARYVGVISEARGGGLDWTGTFAFDVNLGSGVMSGGTLDMESQDARNLVRLRDGSGQAALDRFSLDNFRDAPGGSTVGATLGVTGLDAHLGGNLTLDGAVPPSTTTVDEVRVFQKDARDQPLVESGHGAGALVNGASSSSGD